MFSLAAVLRNLKKLAHKAYLTAPDGPGAGIYIDQKAVAIALGKKCVGPAFTLPRCNIAETSVANDLLGLTARNIGAVIIVTVPAAAFIIAIVWPHALLIVGFAQIDLEVNFRLSERGHAASHGNCGQHTDNDLLHSDIPPYCGAI